MTDESPAKIGVEEDNGVDETTASAPSWTLADRYALAAITVIAGVMRIARVASPNAIMFDETYYAKDSCWYLLADPGICEIDTEQPQVHPPLAKWIIALGIRIFGFDSVGWRIASVVFGTVAVVLLYLVARKLLHSTLGASLAAGLLAFDFLHFVQSRIAMLDIFVPTFGLAALLFVLYDRDRMLARLAAPDERHGNALFDRPWRLWAGLAAGAALASKWTGGLFLVLIVLLTVAWEVSCRRRSADGRAFTRFLKEEAPSMLLWLGVVPALFYMFTYLGRIQGEFLALPWSEGSWIGAFIDHQYYMLDFHRGLDAVHTYQSPPWSWIVIRRPVSYWFETDADSRYLEIFASGNPLVWWPSITAIGYCAYRWVRDRSMSAAPGTIVAAVAVTYGPWLLPWFADRSAVFIFYLLPTVPFMCLAVAYIGTLIANSARGKMVIGAYAALVVATFAFYYPLMANVAIPQPKWDQRIWIFDNCDKPPAEVVTTQITTTNANNEEEVNTRTTESNDHLAPEGWCWI